MRGTRKMLQHGCTVHVTDDTVAVAGAYVGEDGIVGDGRL